jgi:hypothetical protein
MDFTVNPKPYAVAIGEFNGDKLPDVVTANNTSPGTVSVLTGTGTGLLNPATYYNTGTDTHPNGIAVGDVNGDGLADLVTANGEGDSVSFLPATGTFGFGAAVVLQVTPSVSTTYFVSSVAIGDFNQDGMADLVATANLLTVQPEPPGSGNFVVFLATAPGVFGTTWIKMASPIS